MVPAKAGSLGLGANEAEAVAAIDGSRSGWPERDLGVLAAARANRVVHLAWATVVRRTAAVTRAAESTLRPATCAAGGTTLRWRRKALLSEELLLRGAEDEVRPAVCAGQDFVGVGHDDPSKKWVPRRATIRPVGRRPRVLPLPRSRRETVVEGREGRWAPPVRLDGGSIGALGQPATP